MREAAGKNDEALPDWLTRPTSRRKVLTGAIKLASAALMLKLLPPIARAQDAQSIPEEMPLLELNSRVRENVLNGTTEISFDHAPPDAIGKVKVLGFQEGGADQATFIGKALPYLKAHPDETAVVSGHTHPRLVYGRAREARATGGFFGIAPQIEEPTDEQKRKYANHSVPPGSGDAGTYLLEQLQAKKEGVQPRKLLFTVNDAHGTWTSLDRTEKEAEQLAQEYKLPKEMFSKNYTEVEDASKRSRVELTAHRQKLFREAETKVKDPAIQVRLYETQNGPITEAQLTLLQRARVASGLATFEMCKREIAAEWLPKSRFGFRTFPPEWMNTYVRSRGADSYNMDQPVTGFSPEFRAYTLNVFAVLFDQKDLDEQIQLSRNDSFLRRQLSHLNVSRHLSNRAPLVERLQKEYGLADSEMDFAVAALRMRATVLRTNDIAPQELADASAKIRESSQGSAERDIQARITGTSEYVRYRIDMMRFYGQSVTYWTNEDFDGLLHDKARLGALVAAQ